MGTTLFFHNGFGDYVIARPALAALRDLAPRPVRLISGAGPHRFLVSDLGFDAELTLDIPFNSNGRLLPACDLQDEDYRDLLVNLAPWAAASGHDLALRVRARRVVHASAELADEARNAVTTSFQPVLDIAASAKVSDYRLPPVFSEHATSIARVLRTRCAHQGTARLVAVHTQTAAEKCWPAAAYTRVLCATASRHLDVSFVVVDPHPGISACPCHRHRIHLIRGVSLETAMAIVGGADLFLGIDSCMLHIADLCGVPGVALFGATSAKRWGYFWTRAEHIAFTTTETNENLVLEAMDRALEDHIQMRNAAPPNVPGDTSATSPPCPLAI